jgi:hypothetical protein
LPAEIRVLIYRLALVHAGPVCFGRFERSFESFDERCSLPNLLALPLACRQTYAESLDTFYSDNIFRMVRGQQNWPWENIIFFHSLRNLAHIRRIIVDDISVIQAQFLVDYFHSLESINLVGTCWEGWSEIYGGLLWSPISRVLPYLCRQIKQLRTIRFWCRLRDSMEEDFLDMFVDIIGWMPGAGPAASRWLYYNDSFGENQIFCVSREHTRVDRWSFLTDTLLNVDRR